MWHWFIFSGKAVAELLRFGLQFFKPVAFGKAKLSSLLLSAPFGYRSKLLRFVWRSTVFRDATISLGCKPFRCACIPHQI